MKALDSSVISSSLVEVQATTFGTRPENERADELDRAGGDDSFCSAEPAVELAKSQAKLRLRHWAYTTHYQR